MTPRVAGVRRIEHRGLRLEADRADPSAIVERVEAVAPPASGDLLEVDPPPAGFCPCCTRGE